jgi:hypothetical protein
MCKKHACASGVSHDFVLTFLAGFGAVAGAVGAPAKVLGAADIKTLEQVCRGA